MLLFDLSPMYIKSAILVNKDSLENKLLEQSLSEIKEIKYFKQNLSIEINNNKIYFLKVNLIKFEDFKKSNEFSAIFSFLENIRKKSSSDYPIDPNAFLKRKSFSSSEFSFSDGILEKDDLTYKSISQNHIQNSKEKFDNENNLEISYKNCIENENNYSFKQINAYYCGILKSELEKNLEETFCCRLIKTGHTNQLTIFGLDYIFKHIEKSFFFLPGQKVSNLVKVGRLDEVTEKNYTNIYEEFYPFIMANILEGTSVYKVESKENYTRIGGNNFGASSYWSLVSMICGYDDPEKAVEDAIKGNNELIDLSVSDIYGGGYGTFNLDSSLIACSFGKIKYINDMNEIDKKDISRSLMTLMCVTASQICAFLAKQENIKNIIIVGNSFESLEFMQMVQMCVGYFSEDKCKAYFSQYSPFINLIGMVVLLEL